MEKNKREDKFVNGIFSLMISQIIIKIFGMIYSVYLTNKNGFGDTGNAIYMSGYQIYALLLSISSIGIPNAVSKLVSEKIALEDYKGADRVFKISIIIFSGIGFILSSMLFISAKLISKEFLQIPEAEYSLKALSPAIFFVSISSVIRGYCNGRNQIDITAKSQMLEQIFKSIFTIVFVEIIGIFSASNTRLMAAVANLSTTMATITSFIYIFKYNQNIRKKIVIQKNIYNIERISSIIKKIFKVSIPMTMSSLLSGIGKNIDSVTVVRILKRRFGENVAKVKYGILSTKIDLLTNLPLSFNIAFATALVPEISGSLIKNDFDNINKKIIFSLKVTILISIPCSLGIFVYSNEILDLLFPNASAGGNLLKLSSLSIMFACLTQTINGALQGIGKNKVPMIALLLGMTIKYLSNIILIPIDNINEKGAIIGNILSNFMAFCISYRVLRNSIKLDFKLSRIIIKPIIINVIMIISSYFIYLYVKSIIVFEYISLIIGIISGVVIYVFLIFVLKIFTKEEIFLLPNGQKILIFLEKLKKC